MDKFICTKCQFSLTIKKATDTKIVKISTGADLQKAEQNKEEHSEYDIVLTKEELDTFLTKKKEEEKKKLKDFYNKISNIKRSSTKYIFNCTSCGESYILNPETVIYSLNYKKNNTSFNDDYLDLKLYDPTLPRTKDYICPNEECDTNDKSFDMSNKEAVFYRSTGTYHMKYACLVCKHSWLI